MNLVILSGNLSEQIDQKTLPDGQEVIDGCLLKKFTNKATSEEFSAKYFLRITGKNVQKFLRDFAPDDYVLVHGKMAAGGDDIKGYYTRIMVKSICKLPEADIE